MDEFLEFDPNKLRNDNKLKYSLFEFILNEIYGFRSQQILVLPTDPNGNIILSDLALKSGFTLVFKTVEDLNKYYFGTFDTEEMVVKLKQIPFYKAIVCCRIVGEDVVGVLVYNIRKSAPQKFAQIFVNSSLNLVFVTNGFSKNLSQRPIVFNYDHIGSVISKLIQIIPDFVWYNDFSRLDDSLRDTSIARLVDELSMFKTQLNKIITWITSAGRDNDIVLLERVQPIAEFYIKIEFQNVIAAFNQIAERDGYSYRINFQNVVEGTPEKDYRFLHQCCFVSQYVQTTGLFPDNEMLENDDVLEFCHTYWIKMVATFTRVITYLALYAGIDEANLKITFPEQFYEQFSTEFQNEKWFRKISLFSTQINISPPTFKEIWKLMAVWFFQTPLLTRNPKALSTKTIIEDKSLIARKNGFLKPLKQDIDKLVSIDNGMLIKYSDKIDLYGYLAAAPRVYGNLLKTIINKPQIDLIKEDYFDYVRYTFYGDTLSYPMLNRNGFEGGSRDSFLVKQPCFFFVSKQEKEWEIVVSPIIKEKKRPEKWEDAVKAISENSIYSLFSNDSHRSKVLNLGTYRNIRIDVDLTNFSETLIKRLFSLYKDFYDAFLFERSTPKSNERASLYKKMKYRNMFKTIHEYSDAILPDEHEKLIEHVKVSFAIFGI
jgi:hypothetical protein